MSDYDHAAELLEREGAALGVAGDTIRALAAAVRLGGAPPRVSYLTVHQAAAYLGLSYSALRTRLARRARRTAKHEVVANLGGGVRGVKLGRSWRVMVEAP